jgi:hypothetical protein
VLVRTSHSLISAGTESASIGSGGRRENLVLKAIRNPALVMKVVDRVASHGLKSTAELVKTRVSTEMPSGYSCAGVVVDVGGGVVDIHVGDRVAWRGPATPTTPRERRPAEPGGPDPGRRLVREAAFATLGAIALQACAGPSPVWATGWPSWPGPPGTDHGADAARGGRRRHRRRRASRSRGALQALGLDQGFTIAERDFVAGVSERTEAAGPTQ